MKEWLGPARNSWPCISEDGTTYKERCGSRMNWNKTCLPREINNTNTCALHTKFARRATKSFSRDGTLKYVMMMFGKSKLRIASQDVRDKILFRVLFQAAHFISRASKRLKRVFACCPD
jgi:hypothetical protein